MVLKSNREFKYLVKIPDVKDPRSATTYRTIKPLNWKIPEKFVCQQELVKIDTEVKSIIRLPSFCTTPRRAATLGSQIIDLTSVSILTQTKFSGIFQYIRIDLQSFATNRTTYRTIKPLNWKIPEKFVCQQELVKIDTEVKSIIRLPSFCTTPRRAATLGSQIIDLTSVSILTQTKFSGIFQYIRIDLQSFATNRLQIGPVDRVQHPLKKTILFGTERAPVRGTNKINPPTKQDVIPAASMFLPKGIHGRKVTIQPGGDIKNCPILVRNRPIRTRYLGHVTGYEPIRDQYFLIRTIHELGPVLNSLLSPQGSAKSGRAYLAHI
eukprot:sb/3466787/